MQYAYKWTSAEQQTGQRRLGQGGATGHAHNTFGIVVVLACCWATAVQAEQKPLWELGLGIGALGFADYRGATSDRALPIPVPYVVYRGKFFRADEDGVRGLFFHNDRVELSVSFNASAPVNSHDSEARDGMPNLQPTIEIGPELDLHLWRSKNKRLRLDLDLPVRRAITVELTPRAVGWIAAPGLHLDLDDVGGHTGWDATLNLGPWFADRHYHAYFYDVAPEYATSSRHAYQARGGYSGASLFSSVSKRFPKVWVFAFGRYDALAGTTFTSSPLVHRQNYWLGGFGIAWMIGESRHLVEVDD